MSDSPNPLVVEALTTRILLAIDAENWPAFYMALGDVKLAPAGTAESVIGSMGGTVKQVLDVFDPGWASNMTDKLKLLLDVLDGPVPHDRPL